MSNGATTVGNSSVVLRKLNMKLLYDSPIPLLGIYLKKLKTGAQIDTYTLMFTAVFFTITKRYKQPKYWSVGEWIKNVVYRNNGMLLGYKMEWTSDICYSMDGIWKHYFKWNKPDTQEQILYDFTYMKY